MKEVSLARGIHPWWKRSIFESACWMSLDEVASAGTGVAVMAAAGLWNESDQRPKRNLSKGRFESER